MFIFLSLILSLILSLSLAQGPFSSDLTVALRVQNRKAPSRACIAFISLFHFECQRLS